MQFFDCRWKGLRTELIGFHDQDGVIEWECRIGHNECGTGSEVLEVAGVMALLREVPESRRDSAFYKHMRPLEQAAEEIKHQMLQSGWAQTDLGFYTCRIDPSALTLKESAVITHT